MKKIYLLLLFILSATILNAQIWERTNGPLVGTGVNTLAFDGSNTLFAGMSSFNGAYKTSSKGQSWGSAGLGTNRVNALMPLGSNQLIAGLVNGGIYWTNTGGAAWNDVGAPGVSILCFERYSASKIFAGSEDNGVFVSDNNGQNWSALALAGRTVHDIAYDGTTQIYAACGDSLFVSTDAGQNWTGLDMEATSVDIDADGVIYVGSTGLMKSDDQGINWNKAGLDNTNINEIFILSNGDLMIGFVDGAYMSTDKGLTWSNFTDGLPSGTSVSAFAEDNDGFVYCAGTTTNFVYKSISEVAFKPLKLTVTPTGMQQRSYNQDMIYSIKVTIDNGTAFEGATIYIYDEMLEDNFEVTTDANGEATYTTTVPNGKRNDIYDIEFYANADGYQRSGTIVRRLEVLQLIQIILNVNPTNPDQVDWGDEINFEISAKTSLNQIIPNIRVEIEDEVNNVNQEVFTDNEGNAIYNFVVPDNTDDGDYQIKFQAFLDGYIESDIKIRNIRVKKIYQLELQIFPEDEVTAMWWDTVSYEIFVKDDIDRLIPNADINGVNGVNNASIFLTSNSQGVAEYEFGIPAYKLVSKYNIRFLAFKTDFMDAEETIRTVNVIENPVSVPYTSYAPEFNVSPNPANGNAQLEFLMTEAGEAKIELIDITGRSCKLITNSYMPEGMNIISFPVNELEQGTYMLKLSTGDKLKVTKLMVIKN